MANGSYPLYAFWGQAQTTAVHRGWELDSSSQLGISQETSSFKAGWMKWMEAFREGHVKTQSS